MVLKLTLVFLSLIQAPFIQGANISALWDYDFSGSPVCTTAGAVGCLDHFEIGTLQGGAFTLLQSVPMLMGANGPLVGISTNFNFPNPPVGPVTFSVIAVGRDLSGVRVVSDPTKTTVTFTFGPPNFTVLSPTNFKIQVR